MGFWSDFGLSAAEMGMETIGGLISGGINQLYAEKNRQANFKLNEQAADNADKRHRQQFHDLYSYSAQMKELKNAGLNPALMYGGASGQGGATAPQGMGAGGVQAGYSPMDLMNLAQIENIKADTEGKKIENQNKQDEIDADIALKLSQAGMYKASEAYKSVQTEREQLALTVDTATTEDQIKERQNRANKMFWESWLVAYECRSAKAKAEVDEATIQTRIKTETAKYKEILTNIRVGESVVNLNYATAEDMASRLGLAYEQAEIQRLSYEAQKQWFEDQIKNQIAKLNQDKIISEEQLKLMNQGEWLKFATDIFGTIVNGSVGAGRVIAEAIPL